MDTTANASQDQPDDATPSSRPERNRTRTRVVITFLALLSLHLYVWNAIEERQHQAVTTLEIIQLAKTQLFSAMVLGGHPMPAGYTSHNLADYKPGMEEITPYLKPGSAVRRDGEMKVNGLHILKIGALNEMPSCDCTLSAKFQAQLDACGFRQPQAGRRG